jgi:hypothetical protein
MRKKIAKFSPLGYWNLKHPLLTPRCRRWHPSRVSSPMTHIQASLSTTPAELVYRTFSQSGGTPGFPRNLIGHLTDLHTPGYSSTWVRVAVFRVFLSVSTLVLPVLEISASRQFSAFCSLFPPAESDSALALQSRFYLALYLLSPTLHDSYIPKKEIIWEICTQTGSGIRDMLRRTDRGKEDIWSKRRS